MARSKYRYHLETRVAGLAWSKVPSMEGTLEYVRGACDMADSFYPSLPMRVVRTAIASGEATVVKETAGRGSVKLN